jgi:hypothetical protein
VRPKIIKDNAVRVLGLDHVGGAAGVGGVGGAGGAAGGSQPDAASSGRRLNG